LGLGIEKEGLMRKVYRLFGLLTFWSVDFDGFEDESFVSNVGGSYELAPAEEEDEYWEEEEDRFGFQAGGRRA
jgi:hypothetical protein